MNRGDILTEREHIGLDGIDTRAEIIIDKWGIPHIRAGSLRDLFFAQGFNAARDRLWQIDLWRKRGLGRLAADFGPGYLAQDRAARLFIYRGDMDAEWAAYSSDAKEICTAFTAGINAFIALTEREPDRLPPEFRITDTRPARWSPEDVVRIRSHGLTRNALSEIIRATVLAKTDPGIDLLRKNIEPAVTPECPASVDLSALSIEVLDAFKLATAPVTFTPERLTADLEQAFSWTKVTELGDVIQDAAFEGSNNWVVHGDMTDTGRPILANDPHRTHALPSLRYIVHLTAPGIDVIGAGEPSLPGISIGHNEEIAFGLTIFGADQEDVYVYETNDEDPELYRYGDGWERMRLLEERFVVMGASEQTMTLKFTRHGPVIFEDPDRRLAYAIRSVWAEPGAAAYFASIAGMRAKSFEEFRQAMRRWGAPSVNQVYADTTGRIAWLPVGSMPLRPNWNGLLPVPGDGRYEWSGFLDPDALPCVVDPPQGFLATANELNLPSDWNHAKAPVGFEWTEKSRATRIQEVLRARVPHSIPVSCALQTDDTSMPARRLLAVLQLLRSKIDGEAADILLAWDARLAADSAPAALFEVWWTKHLKPALLTQAAPGETIRALLAPGDTETLLQLVESPDGRLGPDPLAARDRLVTQTLKAALRDCIGRMGPNVSDWSWGRLHHAYFEHSLSPLTSAGESLDIGPFPLGGSASTPMHAGYRPSDFRVTAGASVRIIIDVGDWDRSRCINAPGQSGDPRSSHYDDLAPLWASGEYVPLLFSRKAVDDAAETRIELVPEGTTAACSGP